jgi:hypothetical protein
MDTPSGTKDSIPAWIKYSVQAPGDIPYNGIYYDPPEEVFYSSLSVALDFIYFFIESKYAITLIINPLKCSFMLCNFLFDFGILVFYLLISYEIPYMHMQEKYVFKHPQPKRPKSLRIYETHVGMSSPVFHLYLYSLNDAVQVNLQAIAMVFWYCGPSSSYK